MDNKIPIRKWQDVGKLVKSNYKMEGKVQLQNVRKVHLENDILSGAN